MLSRLTNAVKDFLSTVNPWLLAGIGLAALWILLLLR
jgi:hypothetical protein